MIHCEVFWSVVNTCDSMFFLCGVLHLGGFQGVSASAFKAMR